jgi:hypothetical protein
MQNECMPFLEHLPDLYILRGTPDQIRSDSGSEVMVQVVRDWLHRLGVATLFIEPVRPTARLATYNRHHRHSGVFRLPVAAENNYDSNIRTTTGTGSMQ